MTFNDYLNTDPTDSQKIFDFYLNYLGEMSAKDFPFDEQLKLRGAAGKFLISIERTTYIQSEIKDDYNKLISEFQDHLKYYRRSEMRSFIANVIIPSSKKVAKFRVQDSYGNLYSSTLTLINEASNKTYYLDELEINGFYKPDNSNKLKISELIKEAIELIREDESLTEKSKKNLIEYLERVLIDLDREKVNWTKFLGKLKQTIIVLGALGSFAGGISPLFKAKEKLEQTTVVIQNTSINFNYNILNETFNTNTIKHFGVVNNILELPDNSQIIDVEELENKEE